MSNPWPTGTSGLPALWNESYLKGNIHSDAASSTPQTLREQILLMPVQLVRIGNLGGSISP